MKKFSFRVNGTRIGETSRPADDTVDRMPTRRVVVPLRVNASLLVRDYRDGTDDGGGEVA